MCVAKGTLTPTVSLERCELRVARIVMGTRSRPVSEPPVDVFPALEVSSDESQPSAHSEDDHPSLASLDDIDSVDGDGERQAVDLHNMMNARQARRMQRNRESAATSRDRKRKYIADLENQVLELTRTVQTLKQESDFWKLLDLKPEKIMGPDVLRVQRDQAPVEAARASVEAARAVECDMRFVLASGSIHCDLGS